MNRHRRFLMAVGAAVCSSALLLSACGSENPGNDRRTTDVGDPVAGGKLGAIQISEPRTLDPAGLSNTWVHQPLLGNALYGTLMVNNVDSLEIEYKMATAFETLDGGSTFNLTLRPGLTFTDGNPLDAAAVKFNWDRLRDPKLASTAIRQAAEVSSTEVIDSATLKVSLVASNPHFAQGMLATSMNWIASPVALQKGKESFDRAPVGAGPFTLTEWSRQDTIELKKNTGYWDAPKPYLDSITLRTVSDSSQRINAITTGAASLASEGNWSSVLNVQAAGMSTATVPTGGGQYIGMNFRRAPFDDVRARKAISLAVDLDAINAVVYKGDAQVPATLFPEDSPFFTDVAFARPNKEAAQKLFDELAAEGRPVSFTFMSYAAVDARATAEALQAQLSAFDNVDVDIDIVDYAEGAARSGARNFDMMISSAITQDPDYALWTAFHADSSGNFMGVDDQQLSDALDVGRNAVTVEERSAAYQTAQERLVDLAVGLWYVRATPSILSGNDVHGLRMYSLGSPLPEEVWITS